jgi:hypothetical protein
LDAPPKTAEQLPQALLLTPQRTDEFVPLPRIITGVPPAAGVYPISSPLVDAQTAQPLPMQAVNSEQLAHKLLTWKVQGLQAFKLHPKAPAKSAVAQFKQPPRTEAY